MLSDGELLRRYAEDGSQAAFAELVQRHINMVYLAALRRVGRNAHTADDVTQSVFTDLARKARSLRNRPNLAGWLYTGTRFAAAEAVRTERRRRAHEQEAQAMNESDPPTDIPAGRLEAFLDEVMDLLPPRDRDVILLHYFEGCSFPEVGAVLSLSADAARMRANRALDRLRAGLASKGIASSSVALAAALTTQSAMAVSAPMALAVASRAVSHAGASGSGGWAMGRLVHAARLSPCLPWAGAAILVGLAGLSIPVYRWAVPPVSPTAPMETIESDSAAASQQTNPVAPRAVADSPPGLASAPISAATVQSESIGNFAALSEPAKHILKHLWALRESDPLPAGHQWVLHVGPGAPNFADFSAGRETLLAKGWVKNARKRESVLLTAEGIAYCSANSAAIDAYPVFYKIPPPGAP
jgi:RNA polymerase sigma factor (sigma-70 family)